MYAVIMSGGRQYRVEEGQTVKLEKLTAEVGTSVDFKVLMVANGDVVTIGKPYVDGSSVSGSVISQGRHKKVTIMKFRRRKHHQKLTGHRQYFTEIKIEKITA